MTLACFSFQPAAKWELLLRLFIIIGPAHGRVTGLHLDLDNMRQKERDPPSGQLLLIPDRLLEAPMGIMTARTQDFYRPLGTHEAEPSIE